MHRENGLINRVHWENPLSAAHLAVALATIDLEHNIDIVCVGTDRSTGDSLGPFVGSALLEKQSNGLLPDNISVYGTINEPVHALNLEEVIKKLTVDKHNKTIIAIDACLGQSRNIGYISLKHGPLEPGTGVNKQLPVFGDYHIIGVVNVAGFMEHVVLQNTRLSLVIQMAEVITEGLMLYFGLHLPDAEVALGAISGT